MPNRITGSFERVKHAAAVGWRHTRNAGVAVRDSSIARRLAMMVAILVVSVAAAGGGLLLVGATKADIGPFDTTLALSPSAQGETVVTIPPLGNVTFDSHDAPIRLSLRLDGIDPDEAQVIISTPDGVTAASTTLADEVTTAVMRVAVEGLAITTLFGLVVGALVFRTMRRTLLTGVTALAVTAASMGLAVSTMRPEAISEPKYEGLLAYAPTVIGSAEDIALNYEQYVANLQKFTVNIAEFYALAMEMPELGIDDDTIRVLHVSDLHLNPAAWHVMESVVQQFGVDVVADTGDMNDWGSDQEAEIFARGVAQIDAPYLFVKGNHDSAATVAALAAYDNVTVLDGEVVEVAGLRFGGVADPRFTPDKGAQPSSEYAQLMLAEAGERLRGAIEEAGGADVAMVHEPPMAVPLIGSVPLVLAGHTHKRAVQDLGEGTTLMVQGSTGAAGLRVFDLAEPMRMELEVLYFDPETRALVAHDSISIGTVDATDVTLERKVVPGDERVSEETLLENGEVAETPADE
jgi:predicted MPP superfamily phosphohydrolase